MYILLEYNEYALQRTSTLPNATMYMQLDLATAFSMDV